jgi:hypothetical protein
VLRQQLLLLYLCLLSCCLLCLRHDRHQDARIYRLQDPERCWLPRLQLLRWLQHHCLLLPHAA